MPSVTTAIGSYFPERSAFQFVAALVSGVRITFVIIWYLLIRSPSSRVPQWVFVTGILRTCAVGGIIYVPSVDDHDMHDIFLTAYLSLTLVWFWSMVHLSQSKAQEKTHLYRTRIAKWYCLLFIPLLHYFTQHRLYQVPGAYSKYAIFEWLAVALDLLFDAVATVEFESLELRVYDIAGASKGPGVDLYAQSHYV